MIGNTRKEESALAEKDAEALGKMAEELRKFHWEVNTCGRDGQNYLDKARESAKDVLKRVVNYI